jgi:hypothetical protein
MLFGRIDYWRLNELMVPLARKEFFALIIHCTSDNHLHQSEICRNGLRRQPAVKHLGNKIFGDSVVDVG